MWEIFFFKEIVNIYSAFSIGKITARARYTIIVVPKVNKVPAKKTAAKKPVAKKRNIN